MGRSASHCKSCLLCLPLAPGRSLTEKGQICGMGFILSSEYNCNLTLSSQF